uniref:uncharacterized protein LOC120331708 n=1 Tax=Styela clava TaxID=7725 RepID=UPI00193A4AFE|nr:uncharacterized protein LOC120331708 [Styela clava]
MLRRMKNLFGCNIFICSILIIAFLVSESHSSSMPVSTYTENWDATNLKWIVPVAYSMTNFPIEHGLLFQGIVDELAAITCIDLQLKTVEPIGENYLLLNEFVGSTLCEPEYFGRRFTGKNDVKWGSQCTELQVRRIFYAHLGMYYEHQRSDRSSHVVFNPSGASGNLIDVPFRPPSTYHTPYDLESFMSVPSVQGVSVFGLPPDGSSQCLVLQENGNLSELDEYHMLQLYFHRDCPIALPCSSNNPCQNGGSCFDRKVLRPYCACTEYFTGDDCETRVFQCQSDTCKNNGVCTEEVDGSIKCKCVGPHTGKLCDIDLIHPGWIDGGNGHQYKLTSTACNWYEADRQCKLVGGDLAHDGVRDPTTLEFLKTSFSDNTLWIGFSTHAATSAKKFHWIDQINGPWAVHIPWGTGQPILGDSNHCVALKALSTGRALANINCNENALGICEKPIGNPLTYGAYRPGNGKMYFKTPALSTFRVSRTQCLEKGAHLAVTGAATTSMLKDIVDNVLGSSNSYVFVGYESFESYGQYKPILGVNSLPTSDPRWAANEPVFYNYGAQKHVRKQNAVVTSVALNGQLKTVNDRATKSYGLCEAPEIEECTCENGVCITVDSSGAKGCQCSQGYKQDNDGNCIRDMQCQIP